MAEDPAAEAVPHGTAWTCVWAPATNDATLLKCCATNSTGLHRKTPTSAFPFSRMVTLSVACSFPPHPAERLMCTESGSEPCLETRMSSTSHEMNMKLTAHSFRP
eukprot:3931629-Rhodomonas_salina.1